MNRAKMIKYHANIPEAECNQNSGVTGFILPAFGKTSCVTITRRTRVATRALVKNDVSGNRAVYNFIMIP